MMGDVHTLVDNTTVHYLRCVYRHIDTTEWLVVHILQDSTESQRPTQHHNILYTAYLLLFTLFFFAQIFCILAFVQSTLNNTMVGVVAERVVFSGIDL